MPVVPPSPLPLPYAEEEEEEEDAVERRTARVWAGSSSGGEEASGGAVALGTAGSACGVSPFVRYVASATSVACAARELALDKVAIEARAGRCGLSSVAVKSRAGGSLDTESREPKAESPAPNVALRGVTPGASALSAGVGPAEPDAAAAAAVAGLAQRGSETPQSQRAYARAQLQSTVSDC
jgi:hypothetical protein